MDSFKRVAVKSAINTYARAKEKALEEFHDKFLSQILEETGYNISEAARHCGLDRSNFRRVLKLHAKSELRERIKGTVHKDHDKRLINTLDDKSE